MEKLTVSLVFSYFSVLPLLFDFFLHFVDVWKQRSEEGFKDLLGVLGMGILITGDITSLFSCADLDAAVFTLLTYLLTVFKSKK